MNRKVGFALLGVIALATVVYLAVGLSSGPAKPAGEGGTAAATHKDGDDPGASAGSRGAPVVKREEGPGEARPAADAASLALPGALPALKGVQGAAANGPVPPPALPHGQLELEGDVQEADAEAAIKAMWPAVRDCYVELRQRAPQARGRMLMTFKVRPGDAGQAATGEMFLKETQFTDPKYLTCVRAAIDNARFAVSRNLNGSVTVPLFLSPQDAGEAPAP